LKIASINTAATFAGGKVHEGARPDSKKPGQTAGLFELYA
jgi:hypothetical protein